MKAQFVIITLYIPFSDVSVLEKCVRDCHHLENLGLEDNPVVADLTNR